MQIRTVPEREGVLGYLRERTGVDDAGCWLWKLGTDRDGYARGSWDGRGWAAHRLSYTFLVGPIPEGLELDHTCEIRHCVNPAHLEPVTTFENRVRHYLRAGRGRADAEMLATWDLDRWAEDRAAGRDTRAADERREAPDPTP